MTSVRTIDSIATRNDLAEFIRELRVSLSDAPSEWENHDLGSYLEAMAAWLDDMDGYYKNRGEPVPAQPDWKVLAQILAAARVYE